MILESTKVTTNRQLRGLLPKSGEHVVLIWKTDTGLHSNTLRRNPENGCQQEWEDMGVGWMDATKVFYPVDEFPAVVITVRGRHAK